MEQKVKRGDIYYVDKSPYRPTHGSVTQPGRPAIIVSNNLNNKHSYTFEIVYLTTAPKKRLPTHCLIYSSKQPSIALCEQITTVSDEQIRDYQGTCTEEEMRAVDACLAISLGLEAPEEEEPTIEDVLLNAEVDQLRTSLVKAEKEAEVYRTLYESLLAKMLQ